MRPKITAIKAGSLTGCHAYQSAIKLHKRSKKKEGLHFSVLCCVHRVIQNFENSMKCSHNWNYSMTHGIYLVSKVFLPIVGKIILVMERNF